MFNVLFQVIGYRTRKYITGHLINTSPVNFPDHQQRSKNNLYEYIR